MRRESLLAPLGRAMTAALFVMSGVDKLLNPKKNIEYAKYKGLPLPNVLVPAAGAVEVIGGTAILTGFKARPAAAILAAYLIPVTYNFHDFWKQEDVTARQTEMINFLKNLSLMGGLTGMALNGAGPMSLDDATITREDARDALSKALTRRENNSEVQSDPGLYNQTG